MSLYAAALIASFAILSIPGSCLALIGTAIAFGQIGCLAGAFLALIGWHLKSVVEEQFMEEQFGGEYARYKREVKALIPFVW